jgi:phosphoesterase RecJ-like protein
MADIKRESQQIEQLLKGKESVLVLAHKDADGDTLGSALAMAAVLRAGGRQVAVRVPEPVPEIYSFLPGYDQVNDGVVASPDIVLVMDASNLDRLSDVMGPLRGGTPIINIDHHVDNTRFGDVNLVVPEASSTAEVTFELLRGWGTDITPPVATNLYCGVLTDTGGFRHENTTPKALAVASELVVLGAHAAEIAGYVYKRKKISTLKLQALTMATISFELDDRLVHAHITQELLRRAGAEMEESDGIIDLLNSVDGLQLALLFREIAAEFTKVSIRSRGETSANVLAARFGGGGHELAAGAELRLPLKRAMDEMLSEARRMLSTARNT